jgi:hypothetical protein
MENDHMMPQNIYRRDRPYRPSLSEQLHTQRTNREITKRHMHKATRSRVIYRLGALLGFPLTMGPLDATFYPRVQEIANKTLLPGLFYTAALVTVNVFAGFLAYKAVRHATSMLEEKQIDQRSLNRLEEEIGFVERQIERRLDHSENVGQGTDIIE